MFSFINSFVAFLGLCSLGFYDPFFDFIVESV